MIKSFNIPENRIFSSRNIQFKYDIKRQTQGKGVDIVLNSLTGDKMDASFDLVSDSGSFVEIGRYELQMNKKLGTIAFLRDISFIGVALDIPILFSQDILKKFFEWFHENSTNGMIRPMVTTAFNIDFRLGPNGHNFPVLKSRNSSTSYDRHWVSTPRQHPIT